MTSTEIVLDGLQRVRELVHDILFDLSEAALHARVDAEANSIAWLIWHLSRVQDDHLAEIMGSEQIWTAARFAEEFALPFPPEENGYGQSSADVGAVRINEPTLLTRYHDAVNDVTITYLQGLTDADLDRIVDESFTPPVSLGVRLVSVIDDSLQHCGQAAYVRGLVERSESRQG